jgi:hypothetical protein
MNRCRCSRTDLIEPTLLSGRAMLTVALAAFISPMANRAIANSSRAHAQSWQIPIDFRQSPTPDSADK